MNDLARTFVTAVAAVTLSCPFVPAAAGVWGPEARLVNAVGHSWAPQIAAYNGSLHAVWFDYIGALGDSEIVYARSADNGTTWSVPVNLSINSARPDVHPVIAADASGVYVMWSSDVVSGELLFRRSHDNGNSWRPERQLTNTAGYSRSGALAIDMSGTLHAVYYDDRVGYSNIYHRQSCDHGATWTAEQNVTANDGVVDNQVPRLAVGRDGKLYLAFRSSREGAPQGGWPPYQIYLLRGATAVCPGNPSWLHPAQRVTRGMPDEYSDAYGPEVAAGSAGAIHVAFWDQLAGNDVGYRRLDPAASGFGPVRRLANLGANHTEAGSTNAESGNLGISEDNVGKLHLVFGENAATSNSVSYGRIFYRDSLDAGSTWGPIAQVGTTSTAAMPRMLYARGRVHAIWTDFRDNNFGGEVYYRHLDLQQIDLTDHFYRSILSRAPDPGSQAAWQQELARVQALGLDGRETFLVMSAHLFNSAEYRSRGRSNSQFAADLFQAFFNRSPDPGGLSFWVAQLDAGMPRDMVRNAFFLSAEADHFLRGSLDATDGRAGDAIIADFYRSIVNLLPDDGGYVAWRNVFRATQCAGSEAVLAQADAMSHAFFNSVAYYLRGRDNVGYMQDLYLAMMRRYVSLSELWWWTNALNNNVLTREQARQFFVTSPEFRQRVDRVVQEGCLQ